MSLQKDIKLVEVKKEEETVLKNLMSLYLHDLSEFADDLKINEKGQFEYGGLELYFKEKELNAFFIYYNEELVGFVLINSDKYAGKDADCCIHELFVLKAFRKKGIASVIIKEVLNKYRGKYKVVQLAENQLAREFWKSFYKKEKINYCEKSVIEDECACYVQTFHN